MAPDLPPGIKITYVQQHRRCGKPQCRRCREGPGHGPYWYAFWDQNGSRRSRYIGKQRPSSTEPDPDSSPDARAASPDMLRVRSLGAFQVWRGQQALDARSWRRRSAATLFKHFLCAEAHRLHREQAMEALWPDVEPAVAARNLHYAVHLLRRLLDTPGSAFSHLRSEGDWLVLHPDPAGDTPGDWLDADAFAREAGRALAGQDQAASREALARYTGEFLPEDPYDEPAAHRRAELRSLYAALLRHSARLSAESDPVAAIADLRSLLSIEPTHEAAARQLMELLARGGGRHEALRIYRDLARTVRDEFGVAPSAETEMQLQRLSMPPTNLPIPVTSFVGRDAERKHVQQLLGATRLLTLVGTGGSGKTRLALELAAGLVPEYTDGVWLLDLSPLTGPEQVVPALALVLTVHEQAGQGLMESVAGWLRDRRLLLLLDNCEHLLDACAQVVTTLLASCRGLAVLATSREVLGVAGEAVYGVPVLSLPPASAAPDSPAGYGGTEQRPAPGESTSIELLAASEAVQLFAARAKARRPDFALDRSTAPVVAHICRCLDGLPLAIELAAARVGSLTVEGIAARLDDRFRLLTGGARAAPARQQTLRAVMDWSLDLLSPQQQVLFRRLSLFSGGWTLRSAESVCAGETLATAEILDLLEALVNKSLVLLETQAGEERYRFLETVRQYSWEQLEAAGEMRLVRERHLEWCRSLARWAEPELRGPRQVAWLGRLDRELMNLRAALHWCMQDRGQLAAGLELSSLLWRYWIVRGHLSEARRWMRELLHDTRTVPAKLRAAVLAAAGRLAYYQSDYRQASLFYEQSLAIFREHADRSGIAATNNGLGLVLVELAQYHAAIDLFQESLVLNRDLCDTWATASTLNNLGMAAHRQGEYELTSAWMKDSVALYRETGDTQGMANALNTWGVAAMDAGDCALATELLEEGLALYRLLDGAYGMAIVLSNLGMLAWKRHDIRRAGALLREGIAIFRKLETLGELCACLETLAHVEGAEGRHERSAPLLGAADALRDHLGSPLSAVDLADHLTAVRSATAALGEEAFAAAWDAGRRMSQAQAVAYALAEVHSSPL